MKQTKSGTSGFRLQVLTESDHVHSDIQICSATVSLTAPVGLKELQSSEGGTADFGRRGHHLGRRRLCGWESHRLGDRRRGRLWRLRLSLLGHPGSQLRLRDHLPRNLLLL